MMGRDIEPHEAARELHLERALLLLGLGVSLAGCGDKYAGDTPPYSLTPAGAAGQSAAAGSSGASDAGGGDAGGAGASGDGAGGGTAGSGAEPTASECQPSSFLEGANAIRAATPRISLNKRVVASAGVTNAAALVDGAYHQTASVFSQYPASVAIDLAPADGASAPTRILAVWKDSGWEQYTSPAGGAPGSYHFEVSADSTDGLDGTWTAAGAAITGNSVNNRGHALEFTGQRWLRFVVTAAAGSAANVSIDEITVHDVSSSPSGLIDDSWVFFGDSITQLAFRRDLAAAFMFDAKVDEASPGRFPAFVNAGVGGDLTTQGLARLDQALELNADFKYFAIGFGTNDAWGNKAVAGTSYEVNLRQMITRIRDAGRVPVLARIPYAKEGMDRPVNEHTTLPAFNQVVDALQAEYELPCGPDLYQLFESDMAGLGDDGVHPNQTGYAGMNAAWAARAAALYTPAQ